MQSHASLFFFSTLASFINIFLPIILVRVYLPGDIGTFKIYFLYLMSMPILSFSSGIVSGLPLWTGKKENGHVYLQQAFTLNILLVIVTLLIGVIGKFVLHLFPIDTTHYWTFLLCTIMLLLTNYFDELFIALGQVERGGIILAVFEVLKAVSFLFLAFSGYPLQTLFIAYGVVFTVKFLVCLKILAPEHKNKFVWVESVKKQILSYSLPISLSNILSFFLDKADLLILSFFVSKESFAYYGVGCLIVPPLLILEQSVTKVVLPKLSENFHQLETNHTESLSRIKSLYREAIADIGLLNIPGAFGLLIFAKPIIVLLFGQNYETAVLFTRIFSLFYLTLVIPADLLLRSAGDGKSILKLNAIFAPISLGLCLLLTFYYQAYGTLVAFLVIKPIRTWFFLLKGKEILKTNVNELLPLKILGRYLTISILISIPAVFSHGLFSTELKWFLVMGSLFLLTFVVLNWKHFKHLIRK